MAAIKSKQHGGYVRQPPGIFLQNRIDRWLFVNLICRHQKKHEGTLYYNVANYKKRAVSEFIVVKLNDILEHIIPFLEKYPVRGSKYLSYLDFKRVSDILKNKEHLNKDGKGLEEILQIKRRISSVDMNKATNNHIDGSGKE